MSGPLPLTEPEERIKASAASQLIDSRKRGSEGFVKINNVEKQFGEFKIIKGVSLQVKEGEFVVFVGPSGCGKSTLLRMLAGLEEVSGGRIDIGGADVTHLAPADRGVSMVFQSYALYPHMTVRQNISFGLKMVKTPRAEIEKRVKNAAAILKLEQLLDRRPKELSGGQRQRVAIGRAIVRKPKLFLFDEPLSNLDAELRADMRVEIARLHQELGVTMIYVTHDQVEAMTLADRIVVLRAGKVEQIGSPSELYDNPVNTFVAGFIGSPKMNFLTLSVVQIADGKARLSSPALQGGEIELLLREDSITQTGDEVTMGLRPEHLMLGGGGLAILDVSVDYVENLGGTSQLYTRTAGGHTLVAQIPGRLKIEMGDTLRLSVDARHIYLFNAEGHAL
jgi:ABC-type sugar transport system ATPase subunit